MIHRYWTGASAPPCEPWLGAAVRGVHPRSEVTDWTDETIPGDLLDLVAGCERQVGPGYAEKHKANLLRWALLDRFGGVWLDHDAIPLRDLTAIPKPWVCAVGGFPVICAMGFDGGDPILGAMLRRGLDAPDSSTARSPDVSGERVFAEVIPPHVVRIPLPFNSRGSAMGISNPYVVHFWSTGSMIGRWAERNWLTSLPG